MRTRSGKSALRKGRIFTAAASLMLGKHAISCPCGKRRRHNSTPATSWNRRWIGHESSKRNNVSRAYPRQARFAFRLTAPSAAHDGRCEDAIEAVRDIQTKKRWGTALCASPSSILNPREKVVAKPVAIPHHNLLRFDPLSRTRASHLVSPRRYEMHRPLMSFSSYVTDVCS